LSQGWRRTVRRRRGPQLDPDVAAHLGRDGAVVAGDDLDSDVERRELGDRLAGVGLGRVGEGEEPGQVQIALVLGTRSAGVVHLPCSDGHHPGALREQALHGRGRLLRHVHAPAQHRLGRSLRDQREAAGGRAGGGRHQLPIVVERQQSKQLVRR
jgi:hypothetical protein